jgi:hypothetical protein
MYGGHPNKSRLTSACGAGLRAAGLAEPMCRSRRSRSLVPPESESNFIGSTAAAIGANPARPTAQSVACVVVDRCRNAHRSPTEAHLDTRGWPGAPSLASTPSSPSFVRLVQVRESNPRHAAYEAVALPSELTCGGMKQSNRAVRACATRCGTQERQVGLRTHCRCTMDVSTSS